MTPLTKKQRLTSIIILGTIFVLIAPIIVLYSLGYTLDEKFSFQKTGGIFIHSNVSNASVFIDKEFFKTNGIFVRNTLIQDLVPNKKYLIEVNKDNYQSWRKDIFVYPSIVSEGTVFMLPNIFEKREILKYVDKDSVATSTSLVKTQTKATNPEFVSISELFTPTKKAVLENSKVATTTVAADSDLEQKSDIELFFETLKIYDFEKLNNLIINGGEVSWLNKGNISLYWMDDLSSVPYYYCDGEEERVCTNLITLNWEDEIKRFDYLPGRNDVWVVLTSHGIYAVEVDGRTSRNIQTIYLGENLDFRLTQADLLIIKENSTFFEINL